MTAGSANHISTGLAAPPLAITAPASSSGSAPQAAATQSQGRSLARMKRSATAKPANPAASGASHQPADLGAGRGERQGEDREAGGAVAAHALLHVEQALAAGLLADGRERARGLGIAWSRSRLR